MKECIFLLVLGQLKTSAIFSCTWSSTCATYRDSQCSWILNVPKNVRMWHFKGTVPACLQGRHYPGMVTDSYRVFTLFTNFQNTCHTWLCDIDLHNIRTQDDLPGPFTVNCWWWTKYKSGFYILSHVTARIPNNINGCKSQMTLNHQVPNCYNSKWMELNHHHQSKSWGRMKAYSDHKSAREINRLSASCFLCKQEAVNATLCVKATVPNIRKYYLTHVWLKPNEILWNGT